LHNCGTKVDIKTNLGLRKTYLISDIKTLTLDKEEKNDALEFAGNLHRDFLPVSLNESISVLNKKDATIEDRQIFKAIFNGRNI
jgi:hypothetical protein